MSHVWVVPLVVEHPETGAHHLIRSTGHALIFLTERWAWRRGAAYRDAVHICEAAFESGVGHEDARDAFLAAIIGADLTETRRGAGPAAWRGSASGTSNSPALELSERRR